MSGPIAKPVLRNLWISQAKKDLTVGLAVSVVAGLTAWFAWALPKRKRAAAFDKSQTEEVQMKNFEMMREAGVLQYFKPGGVIYNPYEFEGDE